MNEPTLYDGNTALHLAAQYGHYSAVCLSLCLSVCLSDFTASAYTRCSKIALHRKQVFLKNVLTENYQR